MKTQSNRKTGFTLVEIMIVVAIIGLLASIAIPNFVRARATTQANACINNLRQIDGAKQQWALENNQAGAASPASADISPYLGRGTGGAMVNGAGSGGIRCPGGGTYTIAAVQTVPSCSIGNSVTPAHTLP